MTVINNPAILKDLIEQHKLQDIFSINLEECASVAEYDADEIICRAGDYMSKMLMLVEGECIAYSVNQEGKLHCELLYTGLNPMGLISNLWNKPVVNTIKTITPSKFVVISLKDYGEALHNDTKFLNYAILYLANHIRKNDQHFEPLQTRLASFILETSHDNVFSYNLSLCADVLETSQRHLLRTLKQFCEDGLLSHESRGKYLIKDKEALMQQ